MDPKERVEQVFHDEVWGLANRYSAVERAMSEARDLAYRAVKTQGPLGVEAARWLDAYGRDNFRESQLPKTS